MGFDVTVTVATFGAPEWPRLALERAIPSAQRQAPVIHAHGETLAAARNKALERVETEFVIHLDADDELTPGYVEAMAGGSADLCVPLIEQVKGRRRRRFMPQVYGHQHECVAECLREGNWIVIGAAVRTELLREVGGWREFGWSEDWDAWLRCWLAGATIEVIPEAVYRAYFSWDSRNHAPSPSVRNHWHQEIYRANFSNAV